MSKNKPWTPQEDELLTNLVKLHGNRQWTTIANKIHKKHQFLPRASKQYRQRWLYYLNPAVNKDAWTQQQVQQLFKLHSQLGNKWSLISNSMSGRTDNSVKNQFYSVIRKSVRAITRLIGDKIRASTMRSLKPSNLSNIFLLLTEKPSQAQCLFEGDVSNGDPNSKLKSYLANNCQGLAVEIIEFSNVSSTFDQPKGTFYKDNIETIMDIQENSQTDKQEEKGGESTTEGSLGISKKKIQVILEKLLTLNELYENASLVNRKQKVTSTQSYKYQMNEQVQRNSNDFGEFLALRNKKANQKDIRENTLQGEDEDKQIVNLKTLKTKSRKVKPPKQFYEVKVQSRGQKRVTRKKSQYSQPTEQAYSQKPYFPEQFGERIIAEEEEEERNSSLGQERWQGIFPEKIQIDDANKSFMINDLLNYSHDQIVRNLPIVYDSQSPKSIIFNKQIKSFSQIILQSSPVMGITFQDQPQPEPQEIVYQGQGKSSAMFTNQQLDDIVDQQMRNAEAIINNIRQNRR